MFTLKLFRRKNGQLDTFIKDVHHVRVLEIGAQNKTLEIWAYNSDAGGDYKSYYVGLFDEGMTHDNDEVFYGWGLLENQSGRTTQHFRPHEYG